MTQLGLGDASSGSLWHQVPESDAIETIGAAWDAGLAEHVERNAAAFRHPIPADLWAELKHEGLLREDAPVPE